VRIEAVQRLKAMYPHSHVLRHDLCTIVIIFATILDKGPPIDIAHVRNERVTLSHSKQVKTANPLVKAKHDPSCDFLFTKGQNDRKAHLFSIRVAFYLAVHCGALAGLRCLQRCIRISEEIDQRKTPKQLKSPFVSPTSACPYSGPTVYIFTSVPWVSTNSS